MARLLPSLLDWIDRRTGVGEALARQREKRLPARTGWLHTLGTLALALLLLQAVSGALLALNYAPTPDHALDSIHYIQSLPFGRFLRAFHHWGASFVIVVLALHLARVFVWGAYKEPRELLWMVGVLLFLTVLGFGFTGYLLPWDKKGFWATVVGTEVAESAPGLGPVMARFLRGADEVGAPTLTRFYALHALILPALTIVLAALHLAMVDRQGVSPTFLAGEATEKPVRFWPDHVARESVAVFLGVGLLVLVAILVPAPLEPPPDPSETSYDPRPDWYFLFLFQTLKLFTGRWEWIGTLVIPGLGVTVLLLLPFLDRSPERHPRRRPVALALGALAASWLVGMTVWGAWSPRATREPEGTTVVRPVPPASSSGETPPGRRLMDESGCLTCHTIRGEGEKDPDAPDLSHIGSERDAAHLKKFIKDPKSVKPDAKMEPQSHLTDAELDQVVSYLMNLK